MISRNLAIVLAALSFVWGWLVRAVMEPPQVVVIYVLPDYTTEYDDVLAKDLWMASSTSRRADVGDRRSVPPRVRDREAT